VRVFVYSLSYTVGEFFVDLEMNRAEKWFIKNEFFANLSIILSVICLVAILPIQDDSVPSLIIYIWLLYSIFKEITDKET
jgi:hypothetical protein